MLQDQFHHNIPSPMSSPCTMKSFITMLHDTSHHNAPWPYSIKHSALDLLLNPPLVFKFHKNFRVGIGDVLSVENVAHFFPINIFAPQITPLKS